MLNKEAAKTLAIAYQVYCEGRDHDQRGLAVVAGILMEVQDDIGIVLVPRGRLAKIAGIFNPDLKAA
jgi:hypothetical protein